jgi:hypothetical protein
LKELHVKKIALALVAVSALGLAACQGGTEANEAADTNTEATANEAVEDLGNAETAAENALDTAANLAEETGEAVENAAEAVENAAEDATK